MDLNIEDDEEAGLEPDFIPVQNSRTEADNQAIDDTFLHGKTSLRYDNEVPVEEPQPEATPEPAAPAAQQPKPDDKADLFEADAFNVLNTSNDLFGGLAALTSKYNSANWDDPVKARNILVEYGKKIRQKLKVSSLDSKDTYAFAPVKPNDIASPEEDPTENRLDRIERWKVKNLEALDTTEDPDQLASSDLLRRSILKTAIEAEQDVRKDYRDEHWYRFGYIKDKAARFAGAAIDPLHKLVTGGEEFTDLKGYEDPTRANEIGSKLSSLAGTVTGFTLPAAPLLAVGAAPGVAYGAATLLGAAGEVAGRYNLIQEETGDTSRAIESAAIEGLAQAAYAIPFVRLGSKATGTVKALLGREAETAVEEGLLRSVPSSLSAVKQGVLKGAAQGGVSGAAGTVLSNQSLRVGLDNNDASLFEGVADSVIYGGAFGGFLGGIHGLGDRKAVIQQNIKNVREALNGAKPEMSSVDTALHAVKAEEEGKRRDIKRIFKDVLPPEEPLPVPEGETGVKVTNLSKPEYRDPVDTVFDRDGGDQNVVGQKIIKNEDGSIDINSTGDKVVVPKEILEAQLSKPELESSKDREVIIDEKIVEPDSFFRTTEVNDTNEGRPDFKNFFVGNSREKTRQDLGVTSSPVRLMKMLIGNTWSDKNLKSFVNYLKNNIGVRGYFNPKDQKISIPKHLFTSPLEAEQTMLHEFGHWVDYMNDYVNDPNTPKETYDHFLNKTLIQKLYTAKNQLPAMVAGVKAPQVLEQAKKLSQVWRDGWESGDTTSQYGKYRNDPKEIMADVFSAVMMRPDIVKNYKALYRVIDKGWSENPLVSETWSYLKEAQRNPFAIEELAAAQRKTSYLKTYDIENAARAKDQAEEPTRKTKGKQAIAAIYREVFNKYKDAYDIANSLKGEAREQAFELLSNIKAPSYLRDVFERNFHEPIRASLGYIEQMLPDMPIKTKEGTVKGEALTDWVADAADYARAIKIKEEDTPVIRNIQADPLKYMSYVETFFLGEGPKSPYKNEKWSIAKFLPESYKTQLREAIGQKDVGAFTDLLARLKSQLRVAPLPVKTPGKVQQRLERSFDFKGEHPVETQVTRALRKTGRISPVFKDIANDILSDSSFNVRRYLLNEAGENILDANTSLSHLQEKYGENYPLFEKFNSVFHEAMSSTHDIIEQSGLLPPELMERLKINKDSYVTNQVLDYFTGFGDISSAIKKATGSISETGDPFSSTAAKMEALSTVSYMQLAENSKIAIASMGGYGIEPVKVKFGEKIWERRDALNRETKNDHYSILAVDGKKTLVKIKDGYNFKYFNKTALENPVTNFLGNNLELINKMFKIRELRTSLSPVFYIGQKFLDRQNELVQFMQLKGTINPIKAIKEVYDVNKLTKGLLQRFKAGDTKGEIAEAFKAQISTNPMSYWLEHRKNPDTAVEALAKAYGKPLIDIKADAVDRFYDRANEKLDKVLGAKEIRGAFNLLERAIETDELKTKLNGYQLGLRSGMSKAEASNFAINNFGIPDPRGGGVQAPLINKFFLFGRAYLNGIRVAGNLINRNKANAALIFTAGVVLPKLLVSSAAPKLIGSVMGEDAEKSYKKFLDKIPSFEKQGKIVFPVGFVDDKGNLKMLGDVGPDEIGYNWKAAYIRIPQDRAITDMTRATWPIIEEILKGATGEGGNVQRGVDNSFAGTFSGMAGRLNPAAQMTYNIFQYAVGQNPTDLFRGKPVIPKDVFMGGSALDKASAFGQYAASQALPNILPYNPYKTEEPRNIYEHLQSIPVAGPATRAYFGVTNYGQIEVANEAKAEHDVDRATVRFEMGDEAKSIYSKYKAVASAASAYGSKEYKQKLTPEETIEARILLSWGRKMSDYSQNIRMAEDRGDVEQANFWKKGLEKYSLKIKDQLDAIYTTDAEADPVK